MTWSFVADGYFRERCIRGRQARTPRSKMGLQLGFLMSDVVCNRDLSFQPTREPADSRQAPVGVKAAFESEPLRSDHLAVQSLGLGRDGEP